VAVDVDRRKGVAGGLLVTLLGAATVVASREYDIGTPGNMGPGFFPMILGGLLFLFGLLNTGVAMAGRPAEGAERITLGRSMMLPLGVLLFGLLIERAGAVVATLAIAGCVWMAGYGFRIWEILLVTVVLVVISCLMFIYGLQLPTTYLLPW
jgi:hypothetical protein